MSTDAQTILSEAAQADAAERLTLDHLSVNSILDAELSDKPPSDKPTAPNKQSDFFHDTALKHDASQPLANLKDEHFLMLVLEGKRQWLAWQASRGTTCSKQSAEQQASRRLKEPLIAERLRYLMLEEKIRRKDVESGEPLTKQDKIDLLAEAIRDKGTPWNEREKMIRLHSALTGHLQPEGEEAAPDPAQMSQFMRRSKAAGRDPVELAAELRGEDVPEVKSEVSGE